MRSAVGPSELLDVAAESFYRTWYGFRASTHYVCLKETKRMRKVSTSCRANACTRSGDFILVNVYLRLRRLLNISKLARVHTSSLRICTVSARILFFIFISYSYFTFDVDPCRPTPNCNSANREIVDLHSSLSVLEPPLRHTTVHRTLHLLREIVRERAVGVLTCSPISKRQYRFSARKLCIYCAYI